MTSEESIQLLDFFKISALLKDELRHSWTVKCRQESVADHCWRLALMVMVCSSYFPDEFDVLKAIKMALIHDLGEIYERDLHFLEVNKSNLVRKKRALSEEKAVLKLCNLLKIEGSSIFNLWKEFEENKSLESQVVNCLDKIEVCIQHNQAKLSTWTEDEKNCIESYFSQIQTPFLILENLKKLVFLECLTKVKQKYLS